ncbi:MAG: hypothetical protein WC829_05905 [Hyphomicrobium sp.]|jgi:hypothetical protein
MFQVEQMAFGHAIAHERKLLPRDAADTLAADVVARRWLSRIPYAERFRNQARKLIRLRLTHDEFRARRAKYDRTRRADPAVAAAKYAKQKMRCRTVEWKERRRALYRKRTEEQKARDRERWRAKNADPVFQARRRERYRQRLTDPAIREREQAKWREAALRRKLKKDLAKNSATVRHGTQSSHATL